MGATQSLPDWIDAHCRAFTFFGGVTETLVPDNLKGVTQPYEPELNPTYTDMAGVVVLPTRVATRAKVEVAVQVVERWILARLRHQTFFNLDDLNRTIAELLVSLNERAFKKLPGSRRTLFEELEQPALSPLPSSPYVFVEESARQHRRGRTPLLLRSVSAGETPARRPHQRPHRRSSTAVNGSPPILICPGAIPPCRAHASSSPRIRRMDT